jgi:peroxiredoxin
MKLLDRRVFVCIFASLGLAASVHAADTPTCSEPQLLGYVPKPDEVEAHRKFQVPSITYPFGTRPDDVWGIVLTLKVDSSGNVACYSMQHRYDREASSNNRRAALIASLREWHYSPFVRNGKAVTAIVSEEIAEQEAPETQRPLLNVALEKVHIGLERTGCYGSCPTYSVDVYGDGRVVYRGLEHVDVTGVHAYRIPRERVAKLVESARAKGLWSLRESYRAMITDNPTYLLTLDFGGQVHEIEDYVGRMAGMPESVVDFEDEIDDATGADARIHLAAAAVEQLKAAGFNFRSQAGAELLARAVTNKGSRDDQAMLQLVELGAPIGDVRQETNDRDCCRGPLIERALMNQRTVLVEALIQRGALETNGAPDQSKIDGAFRAAIAGGRLALVQKIWSVSGASAHPSLTFDDASEDRPPLRKESPVALLLKYSRYEQKAWDGLAVAQWLAAQGSDIKAVGADGETLLHIAAGADDLEFVRYLLSQGMDPSTPGRNAVVALGHTLDEDVALLLLEAGTDLSLINSQHYSFRDFAEAAHWARVIAWLDAH